MPRRPTALSNQSNPVLLQAAGTPEKHTSPGATCRQQRNLHNALCRCQQREGSTPVMSNESLAEPPPSSQPSALRHRLSLAEPLAWQKRIAAKPTQEHSRESEALYLQKRKKEAMLAQPQVRQALGTSQLSPISGSCFAGDLFPHAAEDEHHRSRKASYGMLLSSRLPASAGSVVGTKHILKKLSKSHRQKASTCSNPDAHQLCSEGTLPSI